MYLRPSTVFASRCTRSGSLPDTIIDLQEADWFKYVKTNTLGDVWDIHFTWFCLDGSKLILTIESHSFLNNFGVSAKINLRIWKTFNFSANWYHYTYEFFISNSLISILFSTWRLVSLCIDIWPSDASSGLFGRLYFISGWDTAYLDWWDNSVCQHTNYSCSFILDILCTLP